MTRIYLLILSLVFMLFSVILSDGNKYEIDLTNEKRNSISQETIKILENLEDKIYIKIYLEGELPSEFFRLQKHCIQLIEKFNSYSNFEIEYELINPSQSETKKQREEYYRQIFESGVHPIWVKSTTKSVNNTQLCFPGAIVSFQEKEVALQIFTNIYFNDTTRATHYEIQHSINKLENNLIKSIIDISEKKKNIAFIHGNGELDTNYTKSSINILSEYYTVHQFDISKYEIDSSTGKLNIQKQLDRIQEFDAIIIAKATEKFQNLDKFILDQYIINGGRILCLLDGTQSNINNFNGNYYFPIESNFLNLEDLFSHYGFKINNNLIQDKNCRKIPLQSINGVQYFNWPYHLLISNNSPHIISRGIDTLISEFTSSISIIDSSKCTVLLSSTINSNLVYSGGVVDLNLAKTGINNPTHNQQHTISILVEGSFESFYKNSDLTDSLNLNYSTDNAKIIVVSDGDIIRNNINPPNFYFELGYDAYQKKVYSANSNFILNSIQYLCGDENLTKIRNKTKEELRIINTKKIKGKTLLIKVGNTLIPLFILFLIYFIFTYIRKQKYAK